MYKQCCKKFQNHLPNLKWVQFLHVNNFAVYCSKIWLIKTIQFSNHFKSFSFSLFFTYKFTACSQSCLVYSLVRVGRFFLSKLPPWTILTSRGIFNYKGLDIKLLNYIGLHFLYTACFGEIWAFHVHFWEKSKKTQKTRHLVLIYIP